MVGCAAVPCNGWKKESSLTQCQAVGALGGDGEGDDEVGAGGVPVDQRGAAGSEPEHSAQHLHHIRWAAHQPNTHSSRTFMYQSHTAVTVTCTVCNTYRSHMHCYNLCPKFLCLLLCIIAVCVIFASLQVYPRSGYFWFRFFCLLTPPFAFTRGD